MYVIKVRLNSFQLDRLSEILGNLGLVFFASLVIPIFTNTQIYDQNIIISGLITSAGCIIGSLILLKGG